MLTVNFRCVSGFFASFAAKCVCGEKGVFMTNGKNSTLFRLFTKQYVYFVQAGRFPLVPSGCVNLNKIKVAKREVLS